MGRWLVFKRMQYLGASLRAFGGSQKLSTLSPTPNAWWLFLEGNEENNCSLPPPFRSEALMSSLIPSPRAIKTVALNPACNPCDRAPASQEARRRQATAIDGKSHLHVQFIMDYTLRQLLIKETWTKGLCLVQGISLALRLQIIYKAICEGRVVACVSLGLIRSLRAL